MACLKGESKVEAMHFARLLYNCPVEGPVKFLSAGGEGRQVGGGGGALRDIGASFYQLGEVAHETGWFLGGGS